MKTKLLKTISGLIKNATTALSQLGIAASYAINH